MKSPGIARTPLLKGEYSGARTNIGYQIEPFESPHRPFLNGANLAKKIIGRSEYYNTHASESQLICFY